MTLSEFLLARLADRREQAARLLRYAQENALAVKDPRLLGKHIPGWHDWPDVEEMARQVLADVDVQRRILDQCDEVNCDAEIGVGISPEQTLAQDVLRLLALPHASHPDYDPSWRPA